MAIKFQFNKTSLNELNKQLKMRAKALPTLKNKESALRLEVQKAKEYAGSLSIKLEKLIASYSGMSRLWNEFEPDLIKIEDVKISSVKIAGVHIPVLEEILFDVRQYSLFGNPAWYYDGLQILKNMASIGIEYEFYHNKMTMLDGARKKTTQKVNLYEKVQIPGYSEAIRKIKRFLEDEENLSKSAQKIVKKRQEEEAGL
ncbi:MAG: V-type ATP synthase subunit D [Prevotellaceae bacterium]|jgi:V/A-type H+-transporting ATPase subunit D|nr:V-type ATP synthase subunit D [Prevotellaceae bacterium]MDR0560858.1 V-type ATP synthase subunit D [Prevotellaceae bacterium]